MIAQVTDFRTLAQAQKLGEPVPAYVADLVELMTNRGYVPSAGSWWEDGRAHVFSVETYGPATYGHPRCEMSWSTAQPDRVEVIDQGGRVQINLPL